MGAHRVGDHRFDHVPVRARDPDAGAVLTTEFAIEPSDRGNGTGLYLRESLPLGEDGSGRVLLHHLPQGLGEKVFDRSVGPSAVVDLGEIVDDHLGNLTTGLLGNGCEQRGNGLTTALQR